MAPDELLENRNWKDHPEVQKTALEAAMRRLGWTVPIIANEVTNRIIDGHLRLELAKKGGWSKVPVVLVALTEEQEAAALASLDSIRAMAQMDMATLKEVLSSVESLGLADFCTDVIPDFVLSTAQQALPLSEHKAASTLNDVVVVEVPGELAEKLETLRFRHARTLSSENFILAVAEAGPCPCST